MSGFGFAGATDGIEILGRAGDGIGGTTGAGRFTEGGTIGAGDFFSGAGFAGWTLLGSSTTGFAFESSAALSSAFFAARQIQVVN